ncbi:MAG TPA: response regulator, partial [Emticicia sp.]
NIKHIPVIMLTTSSSEKDIFQSYKNYVNCYITKPIDVSDFLKVVTSIENFWVSIVTLPKALMN